MAFRFGLMVAVLTAVLGAAPAKAQSLNVEMYDATWFVDFSFAEKEAVGQIVAFLRQGGDRAICVPRAGRDEEG